MLHLDGALDGAVDRRHGEPLQVVERGAGRADCVHQCVPRLVAPRRLGLLDALSRLRADRLRVALLAVLAVQQGVHKLVPRRRKLAHEMPRRLVHGAMVAHFGAVEEPRLVGVRKREGAQPQPRLVVAGDLVRDLGQPQLALYRRLVEEDAAGHARARRGQERLAVLVAGEAQPPRGLGDKAILTLRDLQPVMKKPLLHILGSSEYHAALTKAAAKAAAELAGCIRKYAADFAEPGNLSDRVHQYLLDVGYLTGLQKIYKNIEESEKRQENVIEFINYIGLYERRKDNPCTLAEFMESYSLMDENDRTDDSDDADGPVLSTVHAAKGLEFPIVFIVGMEQGMFPHERSLQENGEEEERRLFYVAVTRAKEELFMTSAAARFKFHEFIRQLPSSFLRNLPDDCVEKPDLETFVEPPPPVSEDELRNAFADMLANLRKG